MPQSLSSSLIKDIRSLQQKKFRCQKSLFVVEGEKLVNEAIASGFTVEAIYRKDEIGEKAMERITSLATPSPVLAVVRQKNISLDELKIESGRVYLVLDGLKDPGNLGTIIRLADWFGVSAIFCINACVELYNPKTIQATMGAIFRVPVVYTEAESVLGKLSVTGIPVWGTFLDGKPMKSAATFADADEKGAVIVMGSESNGISAQVASVIPSENRLLIPSFDLAGRQKSAQNSDGSESLNVATACAAILSLLRLR